MSRARAHVDEQGDHSQTRHQEHTFDASTLALYVMIVMGM